MQRLRVSQIHAGQRFDRAMFLPSGQKLLAAGVVLTQRHLGALQHGGEREVVLAGSVEEVAEEGGGGNGNGGGGRGGLRELTVASLRVGGRGHGGVITAGGRVLVEPGEAVEEHHIKAVQAAGGVGYSMGGMIGDSDTHAVAEAKLKATRRERLLLAEPLVEELEGKMEGLAMRVRGGGEGHDAGSCGGPLLASVSTQKAGDGGDDLRDRGVRRLMILFARLEAGVEVRMREFDPLVDDLLREQAADPSKFTRLALGCRSTGDYLPGHAVATAVLAVATAGAMGWSEPDVRRAALAGCVADLGMLLVPERIRVGSSTLTDVDRNRVQRHPEYALAILQAMPDCPDIVKLAALQHHERENGSGYPRGRRREAICDLARVVGVADTAAAITEPRYHRRAKLPYLAMEETLQAAGGNRFWPPAVRGLLRATGLFPVGSCVKLSNGVTARVIQANGTQLDRPIVQPLTRDGQPTGKPIDLKTLDKKALAVVRAIEEPA